MEQAPAETSRITLVPSAGAPPAASTGAANPQKNAARRFRRRSSVPLLFGTGLEYLEEATAAADAQTKALPPVPAEVVSTPAAPASTVAAPIEVAAGPAPAAAPPSPKADGIRVDWNITAEKTFTLDAGSLGLTLPPATPAEWVGSFPAPDNRVMPAKRKRRRRRSEPLYFRPCIEGLETRLTPATILSTGTGGLWNSTATWVGGALPTTADDVQIVAGATVTLDAGTNTVNSVMIAGSLLGGSQTLTLDGAGVVWNDLGTFTAGTSTIVLTGSAGQSITAAAANADKFFNLTINNAAGVTNLDANAGVDGTLTLTSGAFNISGAALTLGDGVTISLGSGTLSAPPVFGTSVDLIYTNTAPRTTGAELPPAAGTVLNDLTVDGSSKVSLGAAAKVGGTLTVNAGNTFDLAGFAAEAAALGGSGTITNSGGAAATFTVSNAGANPFGGLITDGGAGKALSLIKNGVGTLTLNQANTYSGTTTISAGTIANGVNNALPITTVLTANGTGTLDLNAKNQQLAGLAGNGVVTNSSTTNSSTLTVANTAPTTFAGMLTGSKLGLTINGTAALTLSGTNTFGGITTITAGALLVDGEIGNVSLSGGILGGVGKVGKVGASSGKLDPGGLGVGTLTAVADSNLGGATFKVDLDSTSNDQLTLVGTGDLDLSNATLSVNVLSSAVGKAYTIISGPVGSIDNKQFTGLAQGAKFAAGGRVFQINYSSSAVTLTDVADVTTTTLNASPASPAAFGQTVTFSGTVAGTLLSAIPAGTVQVQNNGVDVSGATFTLDGVTGNFSIDVSTLAVGSGHSITAVYTAEVGSNFLDSTSTAVPYTVNKAATTTAATTYSTSYSLSDQTLTLTGNITSASGAPVNGGAFTFTVGGFPGVGSTVVANGTATATFTLPAGTAAGSITITTAYSGSTNFQASTNNAGALTIAKAATTTVTDDATPVVYNDASQPVTLSATVTSLAGTLNVGTVTFQVFAGATPVGTAVSGVAVVNNVATTTYTLPAGQAAGSYTITATYSGTANFVGSADATGSLTIDQAATTTVADDATAVFNAAAQTITLSADVTSAAGTVNSGTVSFQVFNGATPVGTAVTGVAVVNGVATTTTYTLPAGTLAGNYTITATYSGSTNYEVSTDATGGLTVNPVGTTTAATTESTTYSLSGQTLTLTGNITSANGSPVNGGTFTFTVGAFPAVGSTVVANGTATATFTLPAGTAAGSYTITTAYSGSTNFQASTNNAGALTVDPAVTTTVAVDPPAEVYNDASQFVTLTANVTSAAGTVNVGTVSFQVFAGATPVGTAVSGVAVVNNVATTTYTLPAGQAAGSYTFTATYSGTANFVGSADATGSLTIDQAATTTDVRAATAVFNASVQTITLTADVTSTAGAVNAGTVSFQVYNGATPVGAPVTGVAVVNGVATTTTYSLPAGTAAGSYTVTAVYSGSGNFQGSTDAAGALTVNPVGTTTAATTESTTYSLSGQTLTLTGNITSANGSPVNGGTFTFTVGGFPGVGSTVVANGTATATFNLPAGTAAGSITITTEYSGSANFLASTNNAGTLTVDPAASTTVAGDAPAVFNDDDQSLTLSALVTSAAGTVNAGTVTFQVFAGSTPVGTPVTGVAVVNGTATTTVYTLPGGTAAGPYTITATYSGTGDFVGSADATGALTVSKAATTTTQPGIVSATFSLVGQTLTFTGSVTSANGVVNGGTFTFDVAGLGSVSSGVIVNGAASADFTLVGGTPAGVYTVTTTYSGSANYLGSSGLSDLTVNPAGTTTVAANESAVFSSSNQNVTLSAFVSAVGGADPVNQGTVTFTVFTSGGVQVGLPTTPAAVTAGAASATFVLPGGTASDVYFIHATYDGGGNYAASSDTIHTLTVSPVGTTTAPTTLSPTFSLVDQLLTLTGSVASANGSPVNGGTFTFTVAGLGSVTSGVVVNGTATADFTLLGGTPAGNYVITTTYSGAADFQGSSNNAGSLTVNLAGTTTAPTTLSPTFSLADQVLTLTGNVTSASGVVNGGTFTFTVAGLGSVTSSVVTNGTATADFTLLGGTPAGSYTITTVYSGTPDLQGSSNAAGSLTVNLAATTTVAGDATAVFDSSVQTVTLSAAVTSAAGVVNAGTVTFQVFAGSTLVGTAVTGVAVVNGVATTTYTLPAGTAAGPYTITTTYSGTANFLTSSDATGSLIVNLAATTTVAGDATAVFNASAQSVTLSATVAATSGAGLVNQGTVTFQVFSGVTLVGTAVSGVAVVNGVATTIYTLPGGTPSGAYTIEAIYSGNANYLGSSDAAGNLTIDLAGTATQAASASATFNAVNQLLTFTGVVTSANGPVNGGTFTFTVAGLGSVTSGVVVNGTATADFTLLGGTPAGNYTITTTYNGSADFQGSSNNAGSLTVNQVATTTAPTGFTTDFDIVNQVLTLTGNVSSANGSPVNGGTFTFTVAGFGPVASGVVVNGTASANFTLPAGTPSGSFTITTVYSGSANFQGSSNNAGALTVDPPTPLFATAVTPAAAGAGFSTSAQPLTLTAVVSALGGNTNIYEGTVTFTVFQGATQIGTAVTSGTVVAGNASAVFTLPAGTPVGSYTVSATYNPRASSPDFAASAPGTSALTVSAAGTTTTLTTSLAASLFGQTVTYTATVSSGVGTPTGIVTFVNTTTGATLGQANVVGGTAFLDTPDTLIGANQTITAFYVDAAGNFGGSSGVVTQTVAASLITLTVETAADDVTTIGGLLSLREAVGLASGVLQVSTINQDFVVAPVASTVAGQQQFVINFSGAPTITLTGGVLSLAKMPTAASELVTINGAGVTISGNDASSIFDVGAGLIAAISNATLTDGQSAGNGGAVANHGVLTLTGVTIAASAAAAGGGVYNDGTLTVVNSTIANNTAVTGGGGVHNTGAMTLTSVTISGNATGGAGGGVFTSNSGTLRNTIVAGNFKGAGADDVAGGLDLVNSTFNLIGTGGSGGLTTGGANSNVVGVSVAELNLGALADNGGPTRTMALLPGSRALNAGDPTLNGKTDQRGYLRTHADGVSIGAYQAEDAVGLAVVAPTNVTAGSPFTASIQAVDARGNAGYYTGQVHLTTTDTHAAVKLPPDFTFTTGDRSKVTFTNGFTLITRPDLPSQPTQTITAKDVNIPAIAGKTTVIVDGAAAKTMAFVNQPTDTTAGALINGSNGGVVLVLRDQFGNVANNHAGSVAVSLIVVSDLNPYTASTLLGTLTQTVVGGFATFGNLSIREAGAYFLDATAAGGLGVTSLEFDVIPDVVTRFQVSGASVTAAGANYNFTVTAEDQFRNTVTAFPNSTVLTFTSANAPPDVLPNSPTAKLTNGTGSFTAVLNAAGANFITATAGAITGTVFVNVNSQPTELIVTTFVYNSTQAAGVLPGGAVPPADAGDELTIIVTAYQKDPNNPNGPLIVNANFSNTVSFRSSDPQAVLPPDYTFSVGGAGMDNGVHAFGKVLPSNFALNLSNVSVQLRTSGAQGPGAQTISATDALSGAQTVTIVVRPLAADHLGVSFPAVSTPGAGGTLVISALDRFGNVDPSYVGSIELSIAYAGSSPATVNVPAPFTFTPGADDGLRGFSLVLPTVGSYTISAVGTVGAATIEGSSTVVVVPGSTVNALVSGQQNQLANSLVSSAGGFVSIAAQAQPIVTADTARLTPPTPNRDVIAVSSQTATAVEIEAEGDNPAISLLASGSDADEEDGGAGVGGIDEVLVDESLLPVLASRRSNDGDAGAADKLLWPAAALMSFAEGGVWSVIATFLPDKATGQNNPPSYEGWRQSPVKSANELDEILRGRHAPKPAASKKIDPNAGSALPPAADGSQAVAALAGDELPDEMLVGGEDDRAKFFADSDGRDWSWQMAATLLAAGFGALCAVAPAAASREESAADRAPRAARE